MGLTSRAGIVPLYLDRDVGGPMCRTVRDAEMLELFEIALEVMESLGAEIIDPVLIPEQDEIGRGERWCPRFRFDLERYLASLGVRRALGEHRLDAIVYPTWSNPPRKIGDLRSAHGDNSQDLAPHTGFPAVTVPMGMVGEGLPAGLQLLGDAFTEARLLALAYAFGQATRHRRSSTLHSGPALTRPRPRNQGMIPP